MKAISLERREVNQAWVLDFYGARLGTRAWRGGSGSSWDEGEVRNERPWVESEALSLTWRLSLQGAFQMPSKDLGGVRGRRSSNSRNNRGRSVAQCQGTCLGGELWAQS